MLTLQPFSQCNRTSPPVAMVINFTFLDAGLMFESSFSLNVLFAHGII